MKSYTVYMHISPSNKRYIGITCLKLEKRWVNGNGYKRNKYFYRAIEKYGWDNFEHIIVAKGLDEETAKWLEIELIKTFNTTNKDNGYNISLGGEGANGYHHTDETKQKMSENHANINGENNPFYNKHHTEEAKKKMSEAKKGKHLSDEHREKITEAIKGRKHTEETKKKIGKAHKGKKVSSESRKKMSENHADVNGKNNCKAKSIICLNDKKIFYTVISCSEYYKTNRNYITDCCKGKRKTARRLDEKPLICRYLVWKHNKKYRIVH